MDIFFFKLKKTTEKKWNLIVVACNKGVKRFLDHHLSRNSLNKEAFLYHYLVFKFFYSCLL